MRKKRNLKLVLWVIAIFGIWIGAAMLIPTVENATLDGRYYEWPQKSHINDSYWIEISGDSVSVYRDGKVYEGRIDREDNQISFAGEEYSYLKNQSILALNSIEKIKNLEPGLTEFVKEDSNFYKSLKRGN